MPALCPFCGKPNRSEFRKRRSRQRKGECVECFEARLKRNAGTREPALVGIRYYTPRILKAPRAKLRSLGYRSYATYLRSPHWASVKEAYRAAGRSTTCPCGKPGQNLHHHHYRYIGREHRHLDTLVMLCRGCHRHKHGIT